MARIGHFYDKKWSFLKIRNCQFLFQEMVISMTNIGHFVGQEIVISMARIIHFYDKKCSFVLQEMIIWQE